MSVWNGGSVCVSVCAKVVRVKVVFECACKVVIVCARVVSVCMCAVVACAKVVCEGRFV